MQGYARMLRWFWRAPDKELSTDGKLYLRRWHVIPRNNWFNIYLHNIVGPDAGRALHDHPWWNISVLLRGGYTETIPYYGDNQYASTGPFHHLARRAFSFVFRRATYAHRLDDPLPNTWTLFIAGARRRVWGFYTPFGWLPFDQYELREEPLRRYPDELRFDSSQ